jgi:hypothetical protein
MNDPWTNHDQGLADNRSRLEREHVSNNRHNRRRQAKLHGGRGKGQTEPPSMANTVQTVKDIYDPVMVINMTIDRNGNFDIYSDEKLEPSELVALVLKATANFVMKCSENILVNQ